MTRTTLEHLNLLINQLIINSNLVVVNLVLAIQLNLKLWSDSNIKLELVRSWFFQVYCLLRLRTHWLTQHLNLVISNIFLEVLTKNLIDNIHLYLWTILTLNQTYRYLTLTETRNVGTLTIILESFLYLILVISFLNGDGHQAIHFVGILK